MFKALELENFKAFGTRTRIEFAPITLVYGPNSAGKSSILNALNLLKQTRMRRDESALLLPRAERGLVDLGSFQELLHDHDLTKTLTMRIDLELSDNWRHFREPDEWPAQLGFEIGFRREHDQRDVSLSFLHAYDRQSSKPAVRFTPKVLSESEIKDLRGYTYAYVHSGRRADLSSVKGAICTEVTEESNFWSAFYLSVRDNVLEITRALESFKQLLQTQQPRIFDEAERIIRGIDNALTFYRTNFTLEQFILRRKRAEIGSIILLDSFVPLGPLTARNDNSRDYPEVLALRYIQDARARRWRMFDISELVVTAGRAFESELQQLFPLGPYRRAPKRLYIFTGTTPADVGYSGDLLPDLLFRRLGLVEETNKWLNRLDIGYNIQIKSVGAASNDLFEVRMIDTRRTSHTDISLPDVGFGISQILPFIVQTLASSEQTITIEQPEVHIHPKLQADLADLLIAGIQPARNHRFIVETHSEHLVLRLLRRIRETTDGTLPPNMPKLFPQQVSVVYLERSSGGTKVHHLRIDEQGEFIDRWPEGFFEERAKELF